MDFQDFYRLCRQRGLVAQSPRDDHWQIRGLLLVNYWPTKSRIYIDATQQSFFGSPFDAMSAAENVPEVAAQESRGRRRMGTRQKRRIKRELLAADPACHWCGSVLSMETATLDHRIPLLRAGLDNRNNIVLACLSCNRTRGGDMPELVWAGAFELPPWWTAT